MCLVNSQHFLYGYQDLMLELETTALVIDSMFDSFFDISWELYVSEPARAWYSSLLLEFKTSSIPLTEADIIKNTTIKMIHTIFVLNWEFVILLIKDFLLLSINIPVSLCE